MSEYLADGAPVSSDAFIARALDPAKSCVVEACAGSGKTWLLVGRIVRLLLAGAAPSEILAITFTRKAAQEMRERLSADLQELAFAANERVAALLCQRGLPQGEVAALLSQARDLYERVLAADIGPTIDTFHGWFLRLLKCAPFDAGVPFAPSLLEHTERMRADAWQLFTRRVGEPSSRAMREAYFELVAQLGAYNANAVLDDLLERRADWWAFAAAHSGVASERALRPMREALARGGFDASVPPATALRAERFRSAAQSFLPLLRNVPGASSHIARSLERFDAGLDVLDRDATAALALIREALYTQEGNARDALLPERIARRMPLAAATYESAWTDLVGEFGRIAGAQDEFDALRLNEAALTAGHGLIAAYEELKARQQVLDFTDLEWHAWRLLGGEDSAAYVQARLDARYRHILVDEFQDTNPLQWQVLERWLAAYGADPLKPTVFVVGDPKQSIYAFRRAEPRLFTAAIDLLGRDFGAAHLRTNVTRRNATAIVAMLDTVFSGRSALYQRQATTADRVGSVIVLPLTVPSARAERPASDDVAMRDVLVTPRPDAESDARLREGRTLADMIARAVAATTVAEPEGTRPARWSDVLLLVRRRTHLDALERALREARIPFVSDRMGGLLATLEADDLVATLEFLAAPYLDVPLAHALRSPLFGATDDDLLELAPPADGDGAAAARDDARPVARVPAGATWWRRLRALEQPGERLVRARGLLNSWLKLAGVLPVHDLLDRILFESDARRRYAAAAPPSAHEQVQANLDRVLELALSLDAGRYPSLPRFLSEIALLRRARDQEAPGEGRTLQGDAVRVSTIHGAKGLESEIVVLADAHLYFEGERGFRTLVGWPPHAAFPDHVSVIGRNAAAGRARLPWLEVERERSQQEYWNLLYVAATRARQVLIVSGVQPLKGDQRYDDTWYRRFEGGGAAGVLPAPQAAPALAQVREVRDFLPPPLTVGTRRVVLDSEAVRLGRAWHAVLELAADAGRLDGLARGEIARRFALDEAQTRAVFEAARVVLDAPHLARFFSPPGEAELELIDPDGELLRVDRLVFDRDAWWVLDFKWRVTAAERPGYERQVARYCAVLRAIHPDRPVRGALVTADGGLIELG